VIDLKGHNALVTGAGQRLGRSFAEAIARCGGGVAVHFHSSAQQAAQVVDQIQQAGGRAVAIRADLAQPEGMSSLLNAASEELGEIDLLVNNASIFEPLSAEQTSLESWRRHLDINLTAPFLLSQQLFHKLNGKAGSIVNLLDWRALRPGPDHFPYTIGKAALASLTRALAAALAPSVRVNGLALGAILPPVDGSGDDPLAHVPLGRWGTIEETVEALLFLLAGPDSITGEILLLDGGRHLGTSYDQ